MTKIKIYFYLFRYWQWLKNIIIFIPLLLTDITNIKLLLDTFGLFILFSLFVSSTYVLNDIKDYKEDKKHPKKNKRPIASGEISIKESTIILIFLVLSTLCVTYYFYGLEIITLFIFYLILTIIYSFKIKYVNILDGLLVSVLYLNRLFIGAELANISVTFQLTLYIFVLSMFIFYLKKNSILNTNNYSNKLKESIEKQELSVPISMILNILFVILNIVLIWWILDYFVTTLDFIFIFIFLLLHIILLKDLINFSNKGLLEDISRQIFSVNYLKLKLFTTLIFFILFYYI
tara:strand:+ start:69 stop:938 length:870 start_codon:yes stop_codon:yes gene_type:complete